MTRAVALFWLALLALPATAAPFAFGVVGDLPYDDAERVGYAAMQQEMDLQPLAFVVHAGDIKSGSSHCSDALLQDRLALFSASRHAFILTPGDNDWTDCHRRAAGGYDPEERLQRLRSLFFADGRSLGRNPIALLRQSDAEPFREYRENARWEHDGVTFATVHIPGSDNNIQHEDRPSAEFLRRSAANRDWLQRTFASARQRGDAAVVITIQANPAFEQANHWRPKRAYADFLGQLRGETRAFTGQVLLIHGDSHSHRIDHPMRDERGEVVRNFTRLETYGSPFMGWVKVTVDTARPEVFRFESRPHITRHWNGAY